jgi:hypothetical protein
MRVVYALREAPINASDCMNACRRTFFGVAGPPW